MKVACKRRVNRPTVPSLTARSRIPRFSWMATPKDDPSAARRLTPRGTQRRRQIINLATEKFAADGYHPTSVADIVDGLGVGKGVFYWYFESKEALLEEILREAQKDLRRSQQRAVADSPDPIDRMERGIRAAVHWSFEHRDLAKLVDFAQTDERFARLVRNGRAELVADAIPLLERAMAEGLIPPGSPEQLGYAMLGVSTNLTLVYVHKRGQDPDAIADVAADFCLRGIGAR